MLSHWHVFPALFLLIAGLVLLYLVLRRLAWSRSWKILLFAGGAGLLLAGYALEFDSLAMHLPIWWTTWIQGAALVTAFCLPGLCLGLLAFRRAPQFQTGRRAFLRTTGAAVCLAPLAVTTFGILHRNRFRLSEISIPIPNLPRDLQGLKIVQITDIHLSAFLSESEFATAIEIANETRAHLALITGDLISRLGDPLDACLRQLSRLRADAGVLGCLGNHEAFTDLEEYVTEQGRRLGIEFLRDSAQVLRFGNASINFGGVDYQRSRHPYLTRAGALVKPAVTNVLLSHNPDVFPVAASQGWDLTIAGHTHGGQVNVEILSQDLNVARYYTPYVRGLYREGPSSVYVSTGLGTVGAPVRVGAPPEVSLLRLCAI